MSEKFGISGTHLTMSFKPVSVYEREGEKLNRRGGDGWVWYYKHSIDSVEYKLQNALSNSFSLSHNSNLRALLVVCVVIGLIYWDFCQGFFLEGGGREGGASVTFHIPSDYSAKDKVSRYC